MKMTPELAAALTDFMPVNSAACRETASQAELGVANKLALATVRNHVDSVGQHFAARLAQGPMTTDNGRIKFSFKDVSEVAGTFEMTVMQQVDEPRAEAVAIVALNLMLHDLGFPSCYTDEKDEDHIVAMYLAAHAIDGYRHMLAQDFLQVAREEMARRRRRNLAIGATILCVAMVLTWFLMV